MLTLLRTNLSQVITGEFSGVSYATVSRVHRYVLVDGIHVPAGNRAITGRTNYSGKHHVQCLNSQVAAARVNYPA